MNIKNMRECDNSKIHIRNNSLLSICFGVHGKIFLNLDTHWFQARKIPINTKLPCECCE